MHMGLVSLPYLLVTLQNKFLKMSLTSYLKLHYISILIEEYFDPAVGYSSWSLLQLVHSTLKLDFALILQNVTSI